MEALDLAVGLRPVRARVLRHGREGFAGAVPQVGPISTSIVRKHSLYGDAVLGEPLHRAAQHADGGRSCFVVVDLGEGDAGMVVKDGVNERVSELWATVGTE